MAEAGLEHAGVAAGAVLVAGTEHREQLADLDRSRISEIAWRRAASPPFLASVTNFSTIGRNSLAFGKVVTICSCLISDAHMLANMAVR